MALLNRILDTDMGWPLGVDSTSPLTQIQPGFVREAVNFNISTSGGYVRRGGNMEELAAGWDLATSKLANIRSGFEYTSAAGTVYKMLFGSNAAGIIAKVGYDTGAGITDVLTGITHTRRVSFVQVGGSLFMFNGDGTGMPRVWRAGETARAIGLEAPDAAPTSSAVAPDVGFPGLTVGANYYFAYTFYNSVTGAESTPSTLSTQTAAAAAPNNAVLLTFSHTNTPSAEAATNIRVYRTSSDGNQLFLDGSTSRTAATYKCQDYDEALTTAMEEDNSTLATLGFATPDYPVLCRNRIFLKVDDNTVIWSKIGLSGPMPESFEVKSRVSTIGTYGAGDKIVGLGQVQGIMVVLKERSVGILEELGLPIPDVLGDTTIFNYRELSANIGGISHFAQTQVYDELFFLSKDGVYAIGASGLRPVSKTMKATIIACNFAAAVKPVYSAGNDIPNKRIYFSLCDGTATEANKVLVGHYEGYPNIAWTTYEQGPDTDDFPGIKAGSFFYFTNTTSGALEMFFGNNSNTGQYYKMNREVCLDVTKHVYSKLITRPYSFQQPFDQKLMKRAVLQLDAGENEYEVVVSAAFDLNTTFESEHTFLRSGNELWSGTAPDEYGEWAGDTGSSDDWLRWHPEVVAELNYSMNRRAKFVQVKAVQSTESGLTVSLGVGVQASAQPQK